ncbi:ABC transporter permease, partial [Candidatus Bipolaricaulota bacterium]|nr:ABC transporter permease [Candidatus Bipolaricaulota bacterium]
MLWLLPLRSLWRNRRRALLSIAIISLGTALSVFVLGFLENARGQIEANSVDEYGNYQVASPLLWAGTADGYEYLLSPEHVATVRSIAERNDAFVGSTTQLQFPGLLAAGDRTQVVRVTALEPENGILDFGKLVSRGRPLQSSDAAGILIGRSLAARLSVDVGDVVTLTLTTVDGAYNASPLQIAGVYSFSSEQVELQTLILPLRFAQLLLHTQGVDRVVISLDDIGATRTARATAQAALEAAGLPLEAQTWDELSPFYKQLSSYFDVL